MSCSVVERTLDWGRGEERQSWEQARRARVDLWECNGQGRCRLVTCDHKPPATGTCSCEPRDAYAVRSSRDKNQDAVAVDNLSAPRSSLPGRSSEG